MQRFFLLTFTVCFANLCFSQTNFRNGYIITNEKDTLFGLLEYREQIDAHKSCDFKRSENEQITTYKPGDILGYGFVNETFFESKTVKTDGDVSQAVFLEVLTKGLISLYKFGDAFYIDKEGQQPIRLEDEQKEVFIDGRKILKNSNQHIGIMNMLMHDCPGLSLSPATVSVRQKSLSSVVERYNTCMGSKSVTYKVRERRTEFSLGLVAGVNVSNIEFDTHGWDYYYYLAGSFETEKSPVVGMSFNFLWPRLSNRTSLHVDFLFSKSRYQSHIVSSGTPPQTTDVTCDVKDLKIPIGVRYTFPQKRFTPYVDAGIEAIKHLATASQWVVDFDRDGNNVHLTKDAIKMTAGRRGIWLGVGMLKPISKKVDGIVEFRYERQNGISDPNVIASKITNFQTTVGIRFK